MDLPHSSPPTLAALLDPHPLVISPDTPVIQVIDQMLPRACSLDHAGEPPCRYALILQTEAVTVDLTPSPDLLTRSDENGSRLRGSVTTQDCLRWISHPECLGTIQISDLVKPPALTLHVQDYRDPVSTLRLMCSHQIHYLPVVQDQDVLIGVITTEQLYQCLSSTDLLQHQRIQDTMSSWIDQAAPTTSLHDLSQRIQNQQITSVVITQPQPESEPVSQSTLDQRLDQLSNQDHQSAESESPSSGSKRVPVGILTAAEIGLALRLGLDPNRTFAQDLMNISVPTLTPQDSLWQAHSLIAQNLISPIPVVDPQGALLGQLTETDFLRALDPIAMAERIQHLQQRIETLERERSELLQAQDQLESLEDHEHRAWQLSEARLTRLIDALPFRIWARDRHDRLVLWNTAARQLGRSTIGARPQDSLATPAIKRQWHVLNQMARQEGIAQTELTEVINGEERIILNIVAAVPEEDGWGLIGADIDITPYKRTEAALRQEIRIRQEAEEELQRYGRIISATTDAIALLDRHYRFQLINQAYLQKFDQTYEQIIGRGVGGLIGESFFEQVIRPQLDRCLAGEVVQYEIWHDYPKVGPQMLNVTYSPYQESDGTITGVVVSLRNITDLRETAHELREKTARNRSLLAVLREGIVFHQADGQITYCNCSAAQILGLTADQITGRTSLDPLWRTIQEDGSPFPGDQHPAMFTLRTGQPQTGVVMGVHRSDESLVWILINSQPLFLPDQEFPSGVVVSFSDITSQKNAELALHQAAARDRFLLELTQEIRELLEIPPLLNTVVQSIREWLQADRVTICQFDPERYGKIITESVGSEWPSLLGLVFQDPCFWEWETYYSQRAAKTIDQVNQSYSDPCYLDLMQEFQVQAAVVIPVLQDQKLWGLLLVYQCSAPRHWDPQDVQVLVQICNQLGTALEQVDLYQQLHQSNRALQYQVNIRNEELRQALDSEALLRIISEEVHASLNEDEILQTAVQELTLSLDLGSCYIALLNLDQETYTIIYEHAGSMPSFAGKIGVINPLVLPQLIQGQTIFYCNDHPLRGWCTILACPILNHQTLIGFLKLIRPVHEDFSIAEIRLAEQIANQCAIAIRQARLYQASQHQVQKLEELNTLKDEFVHMVSHELRTPLTNMKMAMRMIETEQLTDKQTRYFQILKAECQREITLVNELLELVALESGTKTIELTTLYLEDWLPTILDSFQPRCQDRQQQLSLTLPPQPQPFTTDYTLLSRLLSELLNNACKYTPPHERIELRVTPTPNSATLHFEVINTGVEIPAADLPHVFERFYRVAQVDQYQQGGTGLGLALVKKVADLLGGQIYVHSGSGQTCFSLELESP